MTDLITSRVLAYRIIKHLITVKEDYPSSMARVLGTTVQHINNELRPLEKAGLVKKGKRTQAQYYTASLDDIYLYFERQLKNDIDRIRDYYQNIKENIKKSNDENVKKYFKEFPQEMLKYIDRVEKWIRDDKEKEEIKDFFKRVFQEYFQYSKGHHLYSMFNPYTLYICLYVYQHGLVLFFEEGKGDIFKNRLRERYSDQFFSKIRDMLFVLIESSSLNNIPSPYILTNELLFL